MVLLSVSMMDWSVSMKKEYVKFVGLKLLPCYYHYHRKPFSIFKSVQLLLPVMRHNRHGPAKRDEQYLRTLEDMDECMQLSNRQREISEIYGKPFNTVLLELLHEADDNVSRMTDNINERLHDENGEEAAEVSRSTVIRWLKKYGYR